MNRPIFFCAISLLLSFAGGPAGAQDKADIEAIHLKLAEHELKKQQSK